MITRTRTEAIKALRQGKSAEQINELMRLLAAKSEQYVAERKMVERLRAALAEISSFGNADAPHRNIMDCIVIAEEALNPK